MRYRSLIRQWNAKREGATFPLVLLFIVLLSIGAIAGLGRISAERRSTGGMEAEVDAYSTAQDALSAYLTTVASPPAASLDTTITGLPGGFATVSVRTLRAGSALLPALYIIRAYGINTGAIRYDERMPSAERMVAQFATWKPGTMNVQAAWTSLTGLNKSGGSGTIGGADQCGAQPAVAGVAVPVTAADGGPGYDQTGGTSVPTGNPAILQPAADPSSFAGVLPLDWNAMINGGTIKFDYTMTGLGGWPLIFPLGWPAIYVNNSTPLILAPANSGRGLLVVKGDLQITGSFTWDGVILVGGVLTSSGNNVVQGAIVSGLNVQLGIVVSPSDIGSGNKTFVYNSCYVTNSLNALGSLVAMTNARIDNWPSY